MYGLVAVTETISGPKGGSPGLRAATRGVEETSWVLGVQQGRSKCFAGRASLGRYGLLGLYDLHIVWPRPCEFP